MNEHEWETINTTENSRTERLKIEGGWLYALTYYREITNTEVDKKMCFVPDSPIKQAFDKLPIYTPQKIEKCEHGLVTGCVICSNCKCDFCISHQLMNEAFTPESEK